MMVGTYLISTVHNSLMMNNHSGRERDAPNSKTFSSFVSSPWKSTWRSAKPEALPEEAIRL
ncbi:hypothetical protein B296_00021636 [Ensete ventricosum]|uniref:Uncharacterized protein n=1 Tax=Ensete ventricosum TaxID=4639 RepID=A0A426ZSH1_ENSVE|nr:hypothetical protein B296_00021636 [Ensete ventricosum]